MAPPTFLANNFSYLETPGVTDVANTITRIIAQALAMGWSNPSGNIIQTPANSVPGQYIQLDFSRQAATTLRMVFTDSFGRTFTRQTNTPATFIERLYFNTQGFAFDPANTEGLWAGIMDLSPELQNAHDQWPIGHGARDSGGTLAGNFQTNGAMQLSSASPRTYVGTALTILAPRGNAVSTTPTAGMLPFSQPGGRLWYPAIQIGPATGTVFRIRGRVYQMLFVSESEPDQSEIVVPIDGATTGTFKVLGFPVAAQAWRAKMAMRKA